MNGSRISDVRFTSASTLDRSSGLLGYVACTLNAELVLDGLTVRRSAKGDLYVSFPCRRDGRGRDHPLIRPLDSKARSAIEGQILEALWAQEAF